MERKLRTFNAVTGILLTLRVAASGFFTLHLAHFAYPIVLYVLVLAAGLLGRLGIRWKRSRQIRDIVVLVILAVMCLRILVDIVQYGMTQKWGIHALGMGLFRVYEYVPMLCVAGCVWTALEWKQSEDRQRLGVNMVLLGLMTLAALLGSAFGTSLVRTVAYWGVTTLGITNACFVFGTQVQETLRPHQKNH